MKRIPPTDTKLSDKLISEGWTKLKEPSNLGIATLLSVPFMFINGAISIIIALYLYPSLKELLNSKQGFSLFFTVNLFTLIYVLVILLFMAIHEFLHACFIPNASKSDKIYWGINGFSDLFPLPKKYKRVDS